MRVNIDYLPYRELDEDKIWAFRGIWPCRWVSHGDAANSPAVYAYRLKFKIPEKTIIRAHVSADERYDLFLDGERIGRGSERGDGSNWYYETYDISLDAGERVLVARVWSLGDYAPYAQSSVRHGFIFSPEGEYTTLLGTAHAPWESKKLDGYAFKDPQPAFGTGWNLDIDGEQFDWGFEKGQGDGWEPVVTIHEGNNGILRNEVGRIHLMTPATLPPMIEREISAGKVRCFDNITDTDTRKTIIEPGAHIMDMPAMVESFLPLTVPADTIVRAIIDLENYYCAYPELVTTGGKGGMVRVFWAESLYEKPCIKHGAGEDCMTTPKGDRGAVEGKYFFGVGDIFRPDGGGARRFDTLWWQAGRYIELLVETADEPLVIESFRLRETRYPLEMESEFDPDDARLRKIIPTMVRGLQMCSHETYMDCPYYEQLMYIGDTRLEALATYATTRDDRLPRKALKMFDASRLNAGITQCRYPTRIINIIPTFGLWWVAMIYDYAFWRDDPEFVKSLMPGARSVIEWWLDYRRSDGLLRSPDGWNFIDWTIEWTDWTDPMKLHKGKPEWGTPPGGDGGVSSVLNMQMALALVMMAKVEKSLGENELADRMNRLASEIVAAAEIFWDDKRGLYADDLDKSSYSEHAQCLAVLTALIDDEKKSRISQGLLQDKNLVRTTIYFSHYLFEAYGELGLIDALFDRLGLWFDLEKYGFKTTFEMPEPSRSDCHAWGAHPLYHYFATILGIRPSAPGFASARIKPQLGHLTRVKAKLPHPRGFIEVDLRTQDGKVRGSVKLPEKVIADMIDFQQDKP